MNTSQIQCVGIIMDGNRRWARERNLPVFDGHAEGYKRLQETLRWTRDAGIKHAVVYAFSTENWQRSEEEVGYLMKLFRSILESETNKMIEERVRVRFIGDRTRFSEDFQKMMADMEAATAVKYDVTLHLLMSYGGRAEIIAATNSLLASGVATITEDSFAEKLWLSPMPDPDLVIRTGGEKRLSNFLPWQTVYSELFFSDSFWPDFSKEEFDAILAEFAARERRHGK
ncbi:MAG: polyprenyl diphosphate synthase [Candidatus Paceibacteria bacterium]